MDKEEILSKNEIELLEKVRQYADDAHGDQKRKYSNENYIRHPERVMRLCSKYTSDLSILAAALLHDVLEDTPVTKEELAEFLQSVMEKDLAKETAEIVVDLTDIYIKKDFPQYNRRKRKELEAERLHKANPKAQTVKYADLIDNSIDITNNDPDFARVFLKEARAIILNMDQGEPELYQKAQQVLNRCFQEAKTEIKNF